jgi:hypothetical protein
LSSVLLLNGRSLSRAPLKFRHLIRSSKLRRRPPADGRLSEPARHSLEPPDRL